MHGWMGNLSSWIPTYFQKMDCPINGPGLLMRMASMSLFQALCCTLTRVARDGDQRFEGKYVPLEQESPDWNGLLEYTWDFGDATPIVHDPMPWHSYEDPDCIP